MKNRLLSAMTLCVVNAALVLAEPPAVGTKAPDFSLQSLTGGPVRLSEFTGKQVALIVLRGYPGYQCPICNKQVHDFIKAAPEFAKLGATVLFVYPGGASDLADRAKEFMADKTFPGDFRMLLDPGYEFTDLYGLRWDAPKETAYPSTFLIDRKGQIFFRKISQTHGDRTSAAQVLEALAKNQQ